MGQTRLYLMLTVAGLALAACDNFDVDLRNLGSGLDTTDPVKVQAAPRPEPDARGIISYPGYQVVVAKRNDTVAAVATRVGVTPQELAAYNGVLPDAPLRKGELLALPRRVATTQPTLEAPEQVDVESLATSAIERAEPQPTPAAATQQGEEPVRHRVKRGETAYSISRLYGVSVRALADWNGLGSDLGVREGQYLLIPVAASEQARRTQAAASPKPGEGSNTPVPPSASAPLPKEKPKPAGVATAEAKDAPASPNLSTQKTAATQATRFARPVDGKIIRDFKKGKNDGVDISAPAGTAVRAAESGTVAAITQSTDKVPIIVVRHAGGLLTVYANVDGLKVKKGDKVKRGQQIAAVRAGSTPFVHFEVRKGLDAVDPGTYLN